MRLAPLMASTDEVHDCGGPVEPTVLSGADRMRASLAGNGPDLDERQVWLGALDELLSLADGLLAETPRRHLAAARTRVAEDRFNLVVLGEFKRGKSTLINALLEAERPAHRRVPLTSVVTTISRRRRRPAAGLLPRRPRGGAPARRAGRVRDRGEKSCQPPGRGARPGGARARPAAGRARAGRHPGYRLDSLSQHGGRARVPPPGRRGALRAGRQASRCPRASASCSGRPPSASRGCCW